MAQEEIVEAGELRQDCRDEAGDQEDSLAAQLGIRVVAEGKDVPHLLSRCIRVAFEQVDQQCLRVKGDNGGYGREGKGLDGDSDRVIGSQFTLPSCQQEVVAQDAATVLQGTALVDEGSEVSSSVFASEASISVRRWKRRHERLIRRPDDAVTLYEGQLHDAAVHP